MRVQQLGRAWLAVRLRMLDHDKRGERAKEPEGQLSKEDLCKISFKYLT